MFHNIIVPFAVLVRTHGLVCKLQKLSILT